MSHTAKLQAMAKHPMHSKMFRRLSHDEMELVKQFIKDNEALGKDRFMHNANRWYLDRQKPKHLTDMWSIVIQVWDFKEDL